MEQAYFTLLLDYNKKQREKKRKEKRKRKQSGLGDFELETKESLTAGLLENEMGMGESTDEATAADCKESLVELITESMLEKLNQKQLGHITKEQQEAIAQLGSTVVAMWKLQVTRRQQRQNVES